MDLNRKNVPSMELSVLWPAIIYYLIQVLMKNLKILTDYSKFHLGWVIIHKVKPISLYSRKLTGAYKSYTVTEKGLLIISETIK